MKKTLLAAALGSLCFASNAMADTILGVYAGAQAWDTGTSGGFSNNSTVSDFNFDDTTQGAFYVALEHPLPFVPNLKVAHTTLDTSGETTLSSNFTFEGNLYTANSTVMTTADLTSTDFILYYELFDNDLISFDLGLNGKYIDGNLIVEDKDSATSGDASFSAVIPMLYSRIEVGLPFTGLGAYAEGSYLAIGSHSISDYQIALTYSFIESLAVDMTAQLGYRSFDVSIEDLDNIYADLKTDGVFAGLEIHF